MQSWIDPEHQALARSAAKALKDNVAHNRSGLPPFRLPQVAQQILAGLLQFLGSGDAAPVLSLGRALGQQGLGLRALLGMSRALVREVLQRLPERTTDALEEVARVNDYLTLLVDAVAEEERLEIGIQRDEIQRALERAIQDREGELRRVILELSTPIMPVYDHILVLPLIGELDIERAGRITESLLRDVVDRQARTVIIDVTGVPAVDAEVVAALVRTARALDLVGAHPVLVGIRPELARALCHHGAELGGIVVLANLQSGVVHALRREGLDVRRVAPPKDGSSRSYRGR
ncbi:anti-anti sigma factor protein [Sorangium cellulosum]|uniref:Anti-anti sigma factor protein n=1 Tax=Sorangium cellulosum TaxID=56 RepID=A0A4P2PTL5_SORCE|nr:STAS domain-containing protein [Sorangium cellulosum]AUX19736.1 anti-anti sigma factor protein [Sorangium cellulosum]